MVVVTSISTAFSAVNLDTCHNSIIPVTKTINLCTYNRFYHLCYGSASVLQHYSQLFASVWKISKLGTMLHFRLHNSEVSLLLSSVMTSSAGLYLLLWVLFLDSSGQNVLLPNNLLAGLARDSSAVSVLSLSNCHILQTLI